MSYSFCFTFLRNEFVDDENATIFCGRPFGVGKAPLIVAEIGFNHNGNVDLACQMIKSAAQNGRTQHQAR